MPAVSSARNVSHGPGSRRPSHNCAAGRELRIVGRAGLRHGALLDFDKIGREQRKPVRRMAEKVGFDQHGGDIVGDGRLHTGAGEKLRGEAAQCVGVETGSGRFHGERGRNDAGRLTPRSYSSTILPDTSRTSLLAPFVAAADPLKTLPCSLRR